MSIPSAVQLFKERFPDANKDHADRLSLREKRKEVLDWWRGVSGKLGLRFDRDWDRLVCSLKAEGIRLSPKIDVRAAAKLKIPDSIRAQHDIDDSDDITESIRLEGLDPVLVYFQQRGLSAQEIADIVEENFDIFSDLLPNIFSKGRFTEIEDVLERREVIAANSGELRKLKFLKSCDSEIPGEVVALTDDSGTVSYDAKGHLVVYVNGEKNRILTVDKSDEGNVWKYAVSKTRVAWLAKRLRCGKR